jgi:hypothetical protein
MASARSADKLLKVEIPPWPLLKALIADAAVDVKVLSVDDATSKNVLYRLQVTAASTLGALASSCGALVLDHGWLRILGAGTEGLEDLATANGLGDPGHRPVPPGHLVVAYDAGRDGKPTSQGCPSTKASASTRSSSQRWAETSQQPQESTCPSGNCSV